MDRFEYVNELMSFYQQLLTDRQREILNYYYFEDLSLSEISDNLKISRNAVFDALRKSEALLEHYESVLHLRENYLKRMELFEKIKNINNAQVNEIVDELIKMEE